MDGLKPYPKMKDSGVPWLGQVPAHWSVLPNRALFAEIKDRNHPDEEMLSVTITKGVVKQKELLADSSKKDSSNLDRTAYKLVQPRDIAYNKMRAWQGAIGASDYRGIISPAYVVMRMRGDANPRYFHHLYRTPQFAKEAERWSYGITSDMWSLRPEHFRLIYSLLPPREEQDAVVRFVRHADREIRNYIRVKQKLIKVLEAQKQAIIHSALTQGIDPNDPLMASRIAWLGDIPSRWDVLRVKQCAQVISKGTTPSTEGREILDSGPVRFLKAENIVEGKIEDKPRCFIDEKTNWMLRRSQLKANDVLFVIAGATLGKTAIVEIEHLPANMNQAIAFIRPNTRVVPAYLAIWLQSPRVRELIWLNAVQSAQPNLSMKDLGNINIALPPTDEQTSILVQLKSTLKKPNVLITSAQLEISHLKALRARLIADTVTGKLDVRDAAKLLPEECEDAEVDAIPENSQDGDEVELEDFAEEAEA